MQPFSIEKLNKIADQVTANLKAELKQQGHNLTNSLENSIGYDLVSTLDAINYIFSYNEYGKYVNRGVKAKNIPYNGRTGRGGTSLYIQALIEYGKKRGIAEKDSKGFAFAVAAKHKKEGMPTKSSSKFSKNGKRTMFQGTVLIEMEKQIPALIDKYLFLELEFYFNELVK